MPRKPPKTFTSAEQVMAYYGVAKPKIDPALEIARRVLDEFNRRIKGTK